MKKRNLLIISAAAVIAAVGFVIRPKKNPAEECEKIRIPASTEGERTEYFASHGWEVEEIAGKEITIPEEFSEAYEEYAELQDKQGLPLRQYAGHDAELYVYEVKNYSPDSKKMLAELIVCDETAAASMVYSDDGGSLRLAVS